MTELDKSEDNTRKRIDNLLNGIALCLLESKKEVTIINLSISHRKRKQSIKELHNIILITFPAINEHLKVTMIQRKKAQYLKNKPKIKEYQKIQRLKNPNKIRDLERKRAKRYNKTIKGKVQQRLRSFKRLQKLKAIIHDFQIKEWNEKVVATGGFCALCKRMVGVDKLTIDHIRPLSKVPCGYVYRICDVQPVCQSCNSIKGNKE